MALENIKSILNKLGWMTSEFFYILSSKRRMKRGDYGVQLQIETIDGR